MCVCVCVLCASFKKKIHILLPHMVRLVASLPLVKVFTPITLATHNSILESVGETHAQCIMNRVDTHGAVLLTGFAHDDTPARAFSTFVQSLGLMPFVAGDTSAAVRTRVADSVSTANEAPHDAIIPFHHELAQSDVSPTYIAFFCETPAAPHEGRTPLVRSRDVAAALRTDWPRCSDEIDRRRVRYVRTLPFDDDPTSPIGKSWRNAFRTSSRERCTQRLRGQGFSVRWRSDGALTTTTPPYRAFGSDAIGRETFFNSIVAARAGWNDDRNVGADAVVFGDGASLSHECRAMLDFAGAYMTANAVSLPWNKGDVLIVDNRQVLHSRQPFAKESERRILASLWGERR